MGLLDPPALPLRQKKALTPVRVPIAYRAQAPLGSTARGGLTVTSELYVSNHAIMVAANSLKAAYANFVNEELLEGGLGSFEENGPNDIWVYAAAAVNNTGEMGSNSGASIIPSGVILRPGEIARFDLGMEVKKNDRLFVRTQVAVDALGQGWPKSVRLNRFGEGIVPTPGHKDVTVTDGSGLVEFLVVNAFGPAVISGIPENGPVPSVLVVGDSISWGIGSGTGNSQNDLGFIPEALFAQGITHMQLGMPSSTAKNFATAYLRQRRMALISDLYFSDAIYQFAVNDLGFALSSLKTAALAGWFALARRGMRVWVTTCLPHTKDSNGTETVAEREEVRLGYNTWVRAGAPISPLTLEPVEVGTLGALLAGEAGHPMSGFIETAWAVEASHNSGTWKKVETTGTLNGTTAITGLPNGHGLVQYMNVYGTNIPAQAQLSAVTANGATLSTSALGSATQTITGTYTIDGLHPDDPGHTLLLKPVIEAQCAKFVV